MWLLTNYVINVYSPFFFIVATLILGLQLKLGHDKKRTS
jgi:hypothetical protein